MNVKTIVIGLARGTGVEVSPDGKTALYAEENSGEVRSVNLDTGAVAGILSGLDRPCGVVGDWDAMQGFVSERSGEILRATPDGASEVLCVIGGSPGQLSLIKKEATLRMGRCMV